MRLSFARVGRVGRCLLSSLAPRRPANRQPSAPKPGVEFLETRDLPSVYLPGGIHFRPGGNKPALLSATPVGTTPSQIRHAYGFDQITFKNGTVTGDGSNTTIAIVDAYDDPNIAGDLQQFDKAYKLPDPTFTKVSQTGSTTNLPSADGGWASEIALDVEWAHAIAPGASILLVEANSNTSSDLYAAVQYAASQTGVVAVSMSWGSGEYSSETGDDSTFTTPSSHAGVTFLASSGDSGAPDSYPSASPNVVSVGGTTLKLDSSGNITSETAWGNSHGSSGGGLSAYESRPDYQAGVLPKSTARGNPDVAYDADPATGFGVYDSYNNGTTTPWGQWGGTSDAAPQWAALIAIADQGRALAGLGSLDGPTQTLPALYQVPAADFHDITSGSSQGTPNEAATTGYDLVTGRGSPVANLLVNDLVNWTSWTSLNTTAKAVVSRANANTGAEETFAIGTDNAVYVNEQNSDGSWAGWTSLGGQAKSIAVGASPTGQEAVFVIDPYNKVYVNYQNSSGTWGGWTSLGGQAKSIAVTTNASGLEDVFAIDTYNKVYVNHQTSAGTWGGWTSLGGNVKSIAVGTDSSGAEEVYAIDTSNKVYVNRQDSTGAWGGWSSLGGQAKSIAVTQDSNGLLDVFVIDPYNIVYENQQTKAGVFGGWTTLGGQATALSAATDKNGVQSLGIIGTDGSVFTKTQASAGGSWGLWVYLGGGFQSLDVNQRGDGLLVLAGQTKDQALWERPQSSSGVW
jgi:hypothetical protein